MLEVDHKISGKQQKILIGMKFAVRGMEKLALYTIDITNQKKKRHIIDAHPRPQGAEDFRLRLEDFPNVFR